MTETLHVRGVTKRYAHEGAASHEVLRGIDLTVEPGEFVSIVGPSGCGKSTLLRLIVGLDQDYQGEITLGARRISGPGPERGIVFQDHRLLPWLTLEENIALAVENVSWPAARKRDAVREHIELVGLTGYEQAFPHQLSGGMAQRAAIARGLVARPEVLLLDEPLGALDALTRIRLQDELLHIWQHERTSMILVTHDIEEALYLSHRVVVLQSHPGRIARVVEVTLPLPRDRASYAFTDLRREVLAAMTPDTVRHEAAVAG
ncbi:ABC transporter ATP-binding protein [Brenneria nigrifluens DSM 30175 = ATCC 13028]|uniref:ABC transporter ATP-binding protein n=4 Tax=Brenneria TaxID=71655 RepID=A0ABX5UX71_9GAMM|nr:MULTISPECIES: ABC transporter ATP-binding protein [Brenneria]EHD20897.1 Taurine-transporting ATPase [Brenneria sp. EniD312]QCR04061.1 ABC transporter ATP-binding protein [Brenneria nigrifluens DSM 30175 = ATCC 13028]